MDNAGGLGCDSAVGVDVRHDVVLKFLFLLGGIAEVDIGDIGFQSGNLFLRDRQTEVTFGAGELYPKPAPCFDAGLRGE